MKKLIAGLAMVACIAACKSAESTSVGDTNDPSMPAKEECGGCPGMKAEGAKADCSAKKAECCPSQKPQG
jgi:hypothetical protein